MTDTAPRGPLAGRRVIELAGIGPGPYAGMLLADMGADVIRIDRPGGVPRSGSPYVDVVNRNKRSIALDLKKPEAVEAVLTLAGTADVIFEGYRPGVAERLGVGPDAVWVRNPKVVYGRMTGWGQDGPLASSAGHDIGYIAITGALGAMGDPSVPPQIPLNLVGDFGGGTMFLVTGILAALLEAERTGRGQVVDAAIVDGAASLLGSIHAMLASGRWVDERGVNLLDGGAPYYSVYETSDGKYMAVGAIEPKFYAELLRLLEIDPAEVTPADQNDRSTWPALRKVLAARFATRSREEWTAVFDGTDACVAPVLGLRAASAHPHIAARGSLVEIDGVLQPGPAPRFSGHAITTPQAPPAVGSDTRAVLAEAGLDADALFGSGAAHEAHASSN